MHENHLTQYSSEQNTFCTLAKPIMDYCRTAQSSNTAKENNNLTNTFMKCLHIHNNLIKVRWTCQSTKSSESTTNQCIWICFNYGLGNTSKHCKWTIKYYGSIHDYTIYLSMNETTISYQFNKMHSKQLIWKLF